MYRILICDDEKNIVDALKIYLESPEYELFEAYNGKQALEICQTTVLDLILLDLMMPVMDGLAAMKEIRRTSNVPIIILSAKSEDKDKVEGLNLGADDYITKPFNPIEVTARVRSQLRRYVQLGASSKSEKILHVGNIELNDDSKVVTVDGEAAPLTKTEYEILKLLMSEPGKVFPSKEIYNRVWENDPFGAENTVAVHIRHLREKIEIDPAHPRYLKVAWGQGYKIDGTLE